MKKTTTIIIFSILVVSFFFALYFYNKLLIANENLYVDLQSEMSQLDLLKYKQDYLIKTIEISGKENNKFYEFGSLKYFELSDGDKINPQKISNLLQKDRETLIVRYTEIGCNSCTDSTFAIMEGQKPSLKEKYNIIVLVDFSNSDAYLKWKKLANITYPVYWCEKGLFPFEIENGNTSYIFTISHNSAANNFFVPKSNFSEIIKIYFNNLNLK
ncbi:MAG: hypothetical protein JWR61_843 [Ferruginibacter sp.]|uniref:hypothetical protein n=1 Tax=Ferruginibacter sp. TaxID=1940288 RepID=UPI0026594903|nr:hypothetical protein [Ferruginibacter sp.]MDB5275888.1 hypothetical protein [Ferruginibacter sp.]